MEDGPLYFESPEQAVTQIASMLTSSEWPTLARYYDLAGTDLDPVTLVSGEFFIRTERPEVAHPAGFWRWRHPFAPEFSYRYATDRSSDVVEVVVGIEIDQGGGMVQEGVKPFWMRRTADGLQVLPCNEDPVGPSRPDWLP